jgi:tRNA (guanine37-N1)-methyltransferase
MRLDFISAVPALLHGPLSASILKRAADAGRAEYGVHDLHDYAHDKHRTVDDIPFGGGAGMILKCEPIFECVELLQAERAYDEVILFTPAGEMFDQAMANKLSLARNIILLCGHYKGIDERVRSLATREVSIGEFVLTGGELPALIVADAIVRLLPGVLHDSTSALDDSFQGDTVDCPHYTRPREFRGVSVPDVLLGGNHEVIRIWREERAHDRTVEYEERMKEWIRKRGLGSGN